MSVLDNAYLTTLSRCRNYMTILLWEGYVIHSISKAPLRTVLFSDQACRRRILKLAGAVRKHESRSCYFVV